MPRLYDDVETHAKTNAGRRDQMHTTTNSRSQDDNTTNARRCRAACEREFASTTPRMRDAAATRAKVKGQRADDKGAMIQLCKAEFTKTRP